MNNSRSYHYRLIQKRSYPVRRRHRAGLGQPEVPLRTAHGSFQLEVKGIVGRVTGRKVDFRYPLTQKEQQPIQPQHRRAGVAGAQRGGGRGQADRAHNGTAGFECLRGVVQALERQPPDDAVHLSLIHI